MREEAQAKRDPPNIQRETESRAVQLELDAVWDYMPSGRSYGGVFSQVRSAPSLGGRSISSLGRPPGRFTRSNASYGAPVAV